MLLNQGMLRFALRKTHAVQERPPKHGSHANKQNNRLTGAEGVELDDAPCRQE